MSNAQTPLQIAIIGAGAAGISTAWWLSKNHAVTLYEKAPKIGGHTNTHVIPDGPDAGIGIDTGFIVCNDKTYPNFHRFLASLNVPWRWSDMSFGFHDEVTGLQYAGTDLNGLFAQRRNIVSPGFWSFLLEIRRFCNEAAAELAMPTTHETLGEFLSRRRFSQDLINNYVVPMGSAIWSTAPSKMLGFPAITFFRFFKNHGLLSIKDRPRWQTVAGGSHSYLAAFKQQFAGTVHTDAQIETVRRASATLGGITIRHAGGAEQRFDRVVIAIHADEVLALLENPSEEEQKLYSVWEYEKNHVVLHTDESVLPTRRAAWASWNYTRERVADERGALSMTYWMNLLQGLPCKAQYSVTLNRKQPIAEKAIIAEYRYTHPLYTTSSIASQERLPTLQGKQNTWFAGSYFGNGFHEDAVKSGAAVVAGIDDKE